MKFWRRAFLLGAPLLICLATIFVSDPFKVLYKYDFGNYYNDQPYELNRDYVSTEMLLSRIGSSAPDAFIFGSSRSFSYLCDSWQKEIPQARCFHYPGANENLNGVYAKIKLLDRLGIRINHALIITDYHAFGLDKRKDHLHILHPSETGESWLNYQTAYLEACFSKLFIIKYIDYKLSRRVNWFTRDIFQIQPEAVNIVPGTNDYQFAAEEKQLAKDEDAFYRGRGPLFSSTKAEAREADRVIVDAQVRRLTEIKSIFDKYQTDYRIIISPLYDQVSLNRLDVARLEEIFGKEHVVNYSGRNEITVNMRNFYDPDHYRPFIADQILRGAYSK